MLHYVSIVTGYRNEPFVMNEMDDDGECLERILKFMDDYGLDPDECPQVVRNGDNHFEIFVDVPSKSVALREANRLVQKEIEDEKLRDYYTEQCNHYHYHLR